jgi:hypothetical protein
MRHMAAERLVASSEPHAPARASHAHGCNAVVSDQQHQDQAGVADLLIAIEKVQCHDLERQRAVLVSRMGWTIAVRLAEFMKAKYDDNAGRREVVACWYDATSISIFNVEVEEQKFFERLGAIPVGSLINLAIAV